MSKFLNIIIIVIVLIFVYMFLKNKETRQIKMKEESDDEFVQDYSYLDDVFNNIEVTKSNTGKTVMKTKKTVVDIKPFFIDMRVHNDYRDTITAFNYVAPDQRPMFNRSVLPVKQIDINPSQVKPLVKAFIKRVNEELQRNVSNEIAANSGWDELAPEKKDRDGWGNCMKDLGLPEDLYLSPAKKAPIKLIKIDTVQKFATEEQINFIIHMIIVKKNAQDQMIVKVSYIMDNTDVNNDRNFNKKDKQDIDLNVRIEEISIIGFLTDHKYGDNTNRQDFYEFNNIEKDDMIDPELVLKTLKDKYKQRQIESDGFNVNIAPQELNNIAMFRLSSERQLKPMN